MRYAGFTQNSGWEVQNGEQQGVLGFIESASPVGPRNFRSLFPFPGYSPIEITKPRWWINSGMTH